MDGVLVFDKPSGMTSHDAVDEARKQYGQKEVGHAGTLDPMATGILLICMGKATRLTPYLHLLDKEYEATILLGQATTTDDAEGDVVSESDASGLTEEEVSCALSRFAGKIDQTPPQFSAVQVGGKRMYDLAREGKVEELASRKVDVHSVEVIHIEIGARVCVRVRIVCGTGVYIRSIARDLGAALGVGGHLTRLRRTRIGRFCCADGSVMSALDAVGHLMRWKPDAVTLNRLLKGQYCTVEQPMWRPGSFVAVEGEGGKLALVARWLPPLVRPARVIEG